MRPLPLSCGMCQSHEVSSFLFFILGRPGGVGRLGEDMSLCWSGMAGVNSPLLVGSELEAEEGNHF